MKIHLRPPLLLTPPAPPPRPPRTPAPTKLAAPSRPADGRGIRLAAAPIRPYPRRGMDTTRSSVGYADVEAAARRLAGQATETPLVESAALNARLGGRVLIKPETL